MSDLERALEIRIFNGADVTDNIVAECSLLFSGHYATWGREAEIASKGRLRAGKFS